MKKKNLSFIKFPSQRFSVSKADCVIRVENYLNNMYSIRCYCLKKIGVDTSTINRD